MSRASANANAGRDGAEAEKPEPTGQLGTDEPLPEWERNLLVNGGQSAGAPVEAAVGANGAAVGVTETATGTSTETSTS
jgi:hypothetical protein